MCEIFCTCEMHDLNVEEERAKNPNATKPAIRKAWLKKYGPRRRQLSLRPVCELCEEFESDKKLMDIEMAIKHRDLSRGFRKRPRPNPPREDPASLPGLD